MSSSIPAGRPQITIVNGTRLAVWVAIYKRCPLRTNEPPVVWEVVWLPSRGRTAILIPGDYQVCARYSFEPDNPRRPVFQTNVLQVPHAPAGAGFVIEGVASPDRRTWGAVLTRAAASPGWYQVRVVNRFMIGVWSHVRQGGRDIFSSRILPPMAALTENLDSPFYLAVLPWPRTAGDLLPDSEIALTEIAVKEGESVKIQGGPYKGFKLSRAPEPDVRTGVKASPTPEKKPRVQAGLKADGKKGAAAKKPAKKVAKKRPQRFTNPAGPASQGQQLREEPFP